MLEGAQGTRLAVGATGSSQPNDQARTMRLKSWSSSPPNGVKALGVRALGTFSGIAVLLE